MPRRCTTRSSTCSGELDRSLPDPLRELGGLQAYPSRTKDPDVVRLLDRLGRPRCRRAAVRGADPALRRRPLRRAGRRRGSSRWSATPSSTRATSGRRSPTRRRRGSATSLGGRPQPPVSRPGRSPASPRSACSAFFADAGWHVVEVKYGAPTARRVRASRAATTLAAASTRCRNEAYQSLFALSGADVRATFLAGADPAVRPDRRRARRRRARSRSCTDLGGHDLGLLLDALPGLRRRDRPADGDLRLHDQGHGPADRGRPAEPRRPARPSRSTAPGRGRPRPRDRVGPVRPRLAGGPAVRRGGGELNTRRRRRGRSCRCPAAARSAVDDRRVSTQEAFGRVLLGLADTAGVGERIVTTAPDVSIVDQPRRLDQQARASWARRASPTSTARPIACCKWATGPPGQHIELGISEMNLFLLLGQLGLSQDLHGERLLPIGTVYDPFVLRGLERFDLRDLQRCAVRRRGHAGGGDAGAGGRRAPVDDHAVDRRSSCPASPTSSRPTPPRWTGCCATALDRLSPGPTARRATCGCRPADRPGAVRRRAGDGSVRSGCGTRCSRAATD